MSKGSVNKVILVGNLGKDPEIKYTASGLAIANMSIATTETRKDKNTNQNEDTVTWHRIVMMGKLAEIAGEYLNKGSKIFIEGRIQNRKWQDKETGKDNYITEVFADQMQMLSPKSENTNKDHYPSLDAGSKSNTDSQFTEDVPF